MDWILWIILPFPIKHQKDDDDDDDDDDSLEVWSNVRVGGNMFKKIISSAFWFYCLNHLKSIAFAIFSGEIRWCISYRSKSM